jgi:photosystem II protein
MAAIAQKSSLAQAMPLRVSRKSAVRPVASGGGKTDLSKVGLNSVADETVKNNLMGKSRYMDKKGWVDSQGRKGKGIGVYRFADKYGANVDGYSPIYTPDQWAETGDSYKLGTRGLIAWAGLVLVLLAIGVNLIVSTSQLGA